MFGDVLQKVESGSKERVEKRGERRKEKKEQNKRQARGTAGNGLPN